LGNVYRLYELEYKLQALKRSQTAVSNPKRIENISNQIKQELTSSANILKKILLKTFSDWLKTHALTNPKKWAEQRYNLDGYMSEKEILETIASEYFRNIEGSYREHRDSEFLSVIEKNLSKLPYTSSILNNVLKMYMKDEYTTDPEGTMENWNVSSPEEADKMIENADFNDVGLEYLIPDIESFVNIMSNHGDLRSFYNELYAKLVFPVWYSYWKDRGIDNTRKHVQNVYNNLKKTTQTDLGNLIAWVNAALNTTHQTGSMLDYAPFEDNDFIVKDENGEEDGSYYAEKLLKALTDGDFNEKWDKELLKAGV
jgi:hypothetical protein